MSTSKRNTKIELLRIIAMLFIIIGHAPGHGGLMSAVTEANQGGIILPSEIYQCC